MALIKQMEGVIMTKTICLWRHGEPLDESILQDGSSLLNQVIKAKFKAYDTCKIVNRDRIPYIRHATHIGIYEGPKTILKTEIYNIKPNTPAIPLDS